MKNYITNSEWLVQKPLTTITYSDLVFCLEHRSVTVRELEMTLTATEFNLLRL